MGKKKNKERDQFDISVEEQLALLAGESIIYDDEYDMGEGADPITIEDSMESALLEKMNQPEDDSEFINNLKETAINAAELPQEIHDYLMNDENNHSKIDMEDEPVPVDTSSIRFINAKFSKDMKTLCISNNKQMFSICLENYPVFDNDINNELDLITMVRDAAVRKMLTCFEPTVIMHIRDFESHIGTALNNLGVNTHIFTYDDEEAVLIYELSDTFMDAINDAIEIAIEDGKLFPMFAALMNLPNDRYFKCDFDRLLMKGFSDTGDYISYLMNKNTVEFAGEEINSSIEKFGLVDVEDIDMVCAKPMEIVNRIMDKLWAVDDDIEDNQGE